MSNHADHEDDPPAPPPTPPEGEAPSPKVERAAGAFRALPEPETLQILDAAIATSVTAVALADPTGRITYVNQAFVEMWRLPSAADAIGRTVHEAWAPAGREAIDAEMEVLLRDGQFRTEKVAQRADGTMVDVELTAALVSDPRGRPVHVMASFSDITARKQAESALRRSEQLLREAQRIARLGSWHLELGTNRLEWSDEIYRMFEIDRAQFGASYEAFLDTIHPDDRAAVDGAYTTSLRDKRPYRITHRLRMKDGRVKFVEEQCETEFAADGRPLVSHGTVQDVTERKLLEMQLLQSQKMELVGRLAGGVAHDFNNLLTVINATAELGQKDLPPGHPVQEACETIRAAGMRAAMLTRQLLAFSRRQLLQPSVVDLNNHVRNIESMLGRLIGEHISVLVLLAPDLGRVRVDPSQLDQVLLNLAVNARDAMPRGGTLTIATANAHLDEGYSKTHAGVVPGPHVMLSVTDTGSGMDESVRERIFEPFFTTKPEGSGTGLGLATVYGIVKQSGGDIWCYSEPGKGTTFRVYFPRVDRDLTPAFGIPKVPVGPGHETILVVDDDEGVRRVARRLLEKNGYHVLTAASGQQALRLLTALSDPVHLLLTDIVMPGMSGHELADHVRALHPGLKILFSSGYTEDSFVQDGTLHETGHFLAKPYSGATLLPKVRELLDAK